MTAYFEIRRYKSPNGRIPISEWLAQLDPNTSGRLRAYMDRMKTGNFGNSKPVGARVLELKINYGPGYRIYYLRNDRSVVILLCGGDKGSQEIDIRRAQAYALDYWRQK